MAKQPKSYVDWTETTAVTSGLDDTSYRIEPGVSKKEEGYVFEEKPTFENWNWLIWNVGRWVKWLSDLFSGYYQIGPGVTADYVDINASMSDGKKSLYIITDTTITDQIFSLSDGFLRSSGAKIISSSVPGTGNILEISGDGNDIDIIMECKQDATNGILISGNHNRIRVRVMVTAAHTLANAVNISGNSNSVEAIVTNAVGHIPAAITDSGTDNNYIVTYDTIL